jgi:threonine/homoserine/homoserine lactone efflux protein
MQPDALWILFSLSFVMALSGALMPGPLLTYTIARTVQTPRNGYLVGAWVIAGHAALEVLILLGLVVGIVEFLRMPLVIRIIGVLGGLLLGYMGVGLIREALARGSSGPFAPAEAGAGEPASRRMHPVLAGILVSMSNPYWWVWWVTVGSASLMRFGVTLQKWQGLAAFFFGHEAADLAWYFAVSTLTHFGRRTLSKGLYKAVLGVCGVVIIGFGIYLGLSLFLRGT